MLTYLGCSTWRPLLPVLEDRPLALCDSRSVGLEDLVAADRVLPDRVGEVYYLRYSPSQQWYESSSRRSMPSATDKMSKVLARTTNIV
jgi:hypothetical protein